MAIRGDWLLMRRCVTSDSVDVGLPNYLHSRWVESSKAMDPWWRCSMYEPGTSTLPSGTQAV